MSILDELAEFARSQKRSRELSGRDLAARGLERFVREATDKGIDIDSAVAPIPNRSGSDADVPAAQASARDGDVTDPPDFFQMGGDDQSTDFDANRPPTRKADVGVFPSHIAGDSDTDDYEENSPRKPSS